MLAFLLPSLIGLALGTVGSIFATIGISFTDWDLLTPAPIIITFFLAQRHFIQGIAMSGFK